MSGVFGRTGFDGNVKPEQWIGSHPRLDAVALSRLGILREGMRCEITLPEPVGSQRAAVTAGKITIGNCEIALRSHPLHGAPLLICPRCGHERFHLHYVRGAWACRVCHNLRYPSRYFARKVPWTRLAWLRRRIGASPEAFTPLPPMRLQARRYWRLAREIRELEEALIKHGRHTADSLDKRLNLSLTGKRRQQKA